MGQLDTAIKALLRADPAAFLHLALGALPLRSVFAEEIELPATSVRLADKVLRFEVEGEPRAPWLHLEVEARPRHATPKRMHEHWTLLHRDLDALVSVLLVLRPGRRGRAARDDEVLRFRFRVIRLRKHDAATLERTGGAGLLPLVLSRVRAVRRRADLQVALAVFAGAVFPAVRWSAMIPQEVLVKSELLTRILAEGRAEVVLQIVRARLGRGASRWGELVRAAEPQDVDRLVDALLLVDGKADTLAALEEALGPVPAPRRAPRRRSSRT